MPGSLRLLVCICHVVIIIFLFLFQAKRSSIKLEIYRKFSNALAVTVIASVVWIGYEVYAPINGFCVFALTVNCKFMILFCYLGDCMAV